MTALVRTIREKLAKITREPWPEEIQHWKFQRGTRYEHWSVCSIGPSFDYNQNDSAELKAQLTEQAKLDAKFLKHAPELLSQAADEIERLERDIEKYKDQLAHYANLNVPPVPDLRFSVSIGEEETP